MVALYQTADNASVKKDFMTGKSDCDQQRARPLAIYWNSQLSTWIVQLKTDGKVIQHGSSKCFGQAFAIRKQTGIPIKKPPGPGRYGETCNHCGIVSEKSNRVMKGCCRKCNRNNVLRRRLAKKSVAGLARCEKCDEVFWLLIHTQPMHKKNKRKDWECPQCKLEKRTQKCDECDTVFSRRKRNEEKGREHYKSFCSDKCFRSSERRKAKPKKLPVLYWTGTKWSANDKCEMHMALKKALSALRQREKARAAGVTWNVKFNTICQCNKHRQELANNSGSRIKENKKHKTWKGAFQYWAKIENHKGKMTWKKKLNNICSNQRTRMKERSLRQPSKQS